MTASHHHLNVASTSMPSLFEYDDGGAAAGGRGGKNRVRACDQCRRKKGVWVPDGATCRELTRRERCSAM